ncbi:uncharacterized protein [Mytilus edulis]|uniref:uncharacterized protein n=1 Tax=Mytilus edulis TaxID=6550 RepID=UPI0039EE650C
MASIRKLKFARQQPKKQSRSMERSLKFANFTSRRAMLEREKAMDGARNPGVSKYGTTLVDVNSKQDRELSKQLKYINSQIKRMEIEMKQKKKYFVKKCQVLNYDPIILVERPPSPEVIKKIVKLAYSDDEDDTYLDPENSPHYMKQLRSKVRTPSLLTTIDAFTVKTSNKKNVWEEATDDKEPMKFESTVRPCVRLTRREKADLQVGWSYHKPRLTPEHTIDNINMKPNSAKSNTPVNGTNLLEFKPENEHFTIEKLGGSDDEDSFTPFITQMAKVRSLSGHKQNDSSKLPKSGDSKSVRFTRSATSSSGKRRRTKSTRHAVLEITA